MHVCAVVVRKWQLYTVTHHHILCIIGEQALVFVSNCDRENKCNTSRISDENRVQKASCGDRTSQIDRKRKGQSMETVISKISKRSSVSSTGEIAEGEIPITLFTGESVSR